MRKIFPVCCARPNEQSAKSMAQRVRTVIFFFMSFASEQLSTPLLNHFIRPRQHIRRNRQTDLLCRFEIDDELELRRLLHGQVGGLGAFQDLVHISRRRAGIVTIGLARRT